LILLGLVLVPSISSSAYGASRWFRLGPALSLQPSELAKLAIVVYLAAWMERAGERIKGFTFGTLPFILIIAVTSVLILVEPDVGTTLVIVLTGASMFFMGGANVVQALLGAAVGSVVLLKYVSSDAGYKADRIQAFLNPWADPSGIGWHTTQTLIALGSGGLAGLGLGASRQKFYFVPNAHTDSIFAIVGEEIGFIGTMLVLGLFLYIAWRGLSVAFSARDTFGRALATGATLMIAWQAMLNMAVVSNTVPNTGVPLPFLSFGGSSMVVCLTAVGMILSVSRSSSGEERSLRNLMGGILTSGRERNEPRNPESPRPRRLRSMRPGSARPSVPTLLTRREPAPRSSAVTRLSSRRRAPLPSGR